VVQLAGSGEEKVLQWWKRGGSSSMAKSRDIVLERLRK